MRIPSADGFGQVVAEPARPDRRRDVTPDSLGAGVFRAIGGIADDMIRTRRIEEAEAARTQDLADRANTTRKVHSARESARIAKDEFVEGVANGTIDKTRASQLWGERMKELRSSALEGVPAKYSADAAADFDLVGQSLSRDINKAVTGRNQSEVRDGLNSTFEAAQRLYMRDPAAANKMVDDAITTFGPGSGMSVEDLGKAKQRWSENTRFTKASEMIVSGRRDNKALGRVEAALSSEEYASMDPQQKVQLMGQIEGFKVANIQRAEAEAARARAAAEAKLRQGEAAFNAANSLVQTGKVLSPEYITQLTEQTKGTPFAAAIPELVKQAPERSAFGMQPLDRMDRTINQIRADLNVKGTDPKTEKRLNELEGIRDQARKDYAADPLIAAQERGIIPGIANLDTRSVAGLVGSLGDRVNQATLVAQQTGQAVSPLTKQEAEQVGSMLSVLPVEQRSSAIAQLAQGMGPAQAAALGRQMAPKDQALGLALALAGDRTTNNRYTSELVLRGDRALKDKAVNKDDKAVSGVRARIAAEIGDAYQDQNVRDAMIDAALFTEYGLQSEGNGNPRNAVRLVTGGIADRNGRKIPLPRGMEANEFDKRLRTLSADSLRTALPGDKVYVSGTAMGTDDFLKQVPDAALIHAGQGRYAVQTGAGLATNAAGQPLIFEVK